MTTHCNARGSDHHHLQARFLAILPRIERHGRVVFRNVTCPVKKADCIAEMVALCWKWIVRLAERGKDGFQYPMALARYAAMAVRSGRRLCGQSPAQDVLSEAAQQKHSFKVESLPISTTTAHEHLYGSVGGQRNLDAFEERLQDNTMTPVPEQAAFRIDFPAWLATLTPRERRIIKAMAQNERTTDLAREFELSPGRISQMRRGFMEDWQRFTAEPFLAPRHQVNGTH